MSFGEIVEILAEKVSDEGLIENETSNLLFSSFDDPNIWTPMDLDCAMPNSSFYIVKLNSQLTINKVNANNHDDGVYLIVRYTKDDISKYLEYIKFEYQSYLNMEDNGNEIIAPIGYIQKQDGILFAFVTSTCLTLNDVINEIKKLPIEKKLEYVIKLIDSVNELLNNNITGFHITSKTVLINKKEGSIGLLGFIGEFNQLQLCKTADHFLYDIEFSAPELKKKRTYTIRAPNSFTDVFSLARVTEFIVGDEVIIPTYKKALISALQKNQNDRLSLSDFKKQMLDAQKESFSEEQQKYNPLFDTILKISTPIKEQGDFVPKYKLPVTITKEDRAHNLKKATVGPDQCEKKEEIRVLVVGKTGSGKTTFINGIGNFLYGVNFNDNCRFIIVSDEKPGQNQKVSQTDDVTSYTLYWQPGFSIPYTVTLVDTPGFGDTRGKIHDEKIVESIRSFFQNSGNCGVDTLNAVAFVVKASDNRLDTFQKYIFSEISKLFGKDIANNIIIVVTFDNGNKIEVLSSFEEVNIPTNLVNRFDNQALFENPNGSNANVNRCLWKNAMENYKKFFINVYNLKPVSLYLSQKVLLQRKSLNITIDNLNTKIRVGLAEMEILKQKLEIMEDNKKKIEANRNFRVKNYEMEWQKRTLREGEYVTNCQNCHKSCHYPCYIKLNSEKRGCAAIGSDGYCKQCGCYWEDHQNDPFRWEYVSVCREVTLSTIKKDFDDANSNKPIVERMVDNAVNQYINIWEECTKLVTQCKKCIDELHEIALKPISLSQKEYIENQIEDEKNSRRPDWKKRVEWYENLIKQQENIERISRGENVIAIPHDQEIKEFLERRLGRKLYT